MLYAVNSQFVDTLEGPYVQRFELNGYRILEPIRGRRHTHKAKTMFLVLDNAIGTDDVIHGEVLSRISTSHQTTSKHVTEKWIAEITAKNKTKCAGIKTQEIESVGVDA